MRKLFECLVSWGKNRERAFPVTLSIKPAVLMPATNVVKLPAAIAVSTIFFDNAVWLVFPCWLLEALFDSLINLGLNV